MVASEIEDAVLAQRLANGRGIEYEMPDTGKSRGCRPLATKTNRFALIDSLCQTYYESQGTKLERKAIVEKVKSEIDAVRTDSFPEMEQAVNDCRNNVLVKIKEEFPELKPEDYMLLVYLASGLSTRTICLLLDESVNVIYKRKSRLKSRLKAHAGIENSGIMAIF